MSDDDLIRRGDALQLVEDYETIHDRISLLPAADARAEALLQRAAQMAYEVWDDPEALAKAILALIPETKP